MISIQNRLILLFLTLSFSLFGQEITQINGYAPAFVGEKIEIYEIQDYFTLRESLIASSIVKKDSSFSFVFYNNRIQKIVIRCHKNKSYLYIEPKGKYEVLFPDKNPYDVFNPNGNDVEVSFFKLPENDINYKILSLDKWINQFLGNYYYTRSMGGTDFVKNLDTFKINVQKAYESDTSFYFKTYVKFAIASLEDIPFKGNRNRYEKFDFFLNQFPVEYKNDLYMSYISNFYDNLLPRLSMEVNNRVYLGLLKNSPTLILNALSDEYTLKAKNVRLRELIMIKALSDNYFKGDLPQTNIISVLDSLSNHALFPENRLIAANYIFRLNQLVPGSKAPDFVENTRKNEKKSLYAYQGKHLYIQFFDPKLKTSLQEIELLKEIYKKYGGEVNFISIYEKQPELSKKAVASIESIPWDVYELEAENPIFKKYQISSFPEYVLIDPAGYIVSSPALGPLPNGQYETIDKTFFLIGKVNKQLKEER